MSRAVQYFVIVFSIVVFYNLITMTLHHINDTPRKWTSSGHVVVDPVIEMPENDQKLRKERSLFHVAVTASDTPYSKWQCRIMYYWYKKKKDLPGSDMGKFTRILHSGYEDNLMDEIPTFVVDPLPPGLDRGYVVLNRPWAFVQWLKMAVIEEEYVLMAEPDHIFLKALPNLAYEAYPAAFPFFYITPRKHDKIIRKYFPEEMGPITNVDPIGNSPVIIRKGMLETIAPTWMNVSLKMKNDNETDTTFGWVLEMYAYAVASALHGVQHILRKDFQLQPPWDKETENKFILHFTYGCDFTLKGELVYIYNKIGEWHFDKREYLDGPPPQNLPLPPPGVPESVVTLIEMINEATSNLPNWDTLGESTSLIETDNS